MKDGGRAKHKRIIAAMDAFYIPPGSVAQPPPDRPSVGAPEPNQKPLYQWTSGATSPWPLVNLLKDWPPAAPSVAPAPEVALPRHRNHLAGTLAAVIVVVIALGAVGYVWLGSPHRSKAVAIQTPTPSPALKASPSPSQTPTPTPTPTPAPAPTPQTVSAPAVQPTASAPQEVTVTDAHGLWLRSSPTSVDRSNIIDWMPQGAKISVDATSGFWWHGTYGGKTGYFASSYTQ